MDIWASILGFIGGVLLVIDAFSPVRQLLLRGGEDRWAWLRSQILTTQAITPGPTQPPANDQKALNKARTSQLLTRAGFVFVTLGFLLDLLSKFHARCP